MLIEANLLVLKTCYTNSYRRTYFTSVVARRTTAAVDIHPFKTHTVLACYREQLLHRYCKATRKHIQASGEVPRDNSKQTPKRNYPSQL